MKKSICSISLAVLSVSAVMSTFIAQGDEDLQSQSQQAIGNFEKKDSTMQSFIAGSAGYAVFPDVGKGGFIIGGARGKGLLYEKGAVTGQATMTQASIGAQAGGESFSEIIVFDTPEAVQNFKGNNFEMSADVSAVISAEGASKSAKYRHGVAVFTLPKKGLMVQASIGGQKFKYEPLAQTGR